jgi:NTE family protein
MTENEDLSNLSVDIYEYQTLKNISFSGGGFRGLAFLGCVKALQEKDLIQSAKSFAGSSVGAFIATLVVCGADYQYLKEASVGACKFFSNFNFDILSFLKKGNVGFRSSFGIYRTEDLRDYLKTCIQRVLNVDYDVTFGDLYSRNPVDLIITASCLETKTPFYFSHTTTKDVTVSEALSISCSIPLLFGKTMFDNKTLVDGCLVERLPMQCWPQEEIENTMAFLLDSRNRVVNTNTLTDYIHALESTMAISQEDGYLSKYKNAITTINSGRIVSTGQIPSSEEINRVVYAAYFQTLSELARRNFIDEYSIPKSQEISSLILNENAFSLSEPTNYNIIYKLLILLIIVSIII